MRENVLLLITILGILSYFIPAVIVYMKKLWNDFPLRLVCIYWMVCGFMNSLDLIGPIDYRVMEIFHVSYNFVVIPFVLFLIYLNTGSAWMKKMLPVAIGLVALVELAGIIRGGLYYDSLKYGLGLGIVLLLIFIFWEILRFFQNISHTTREKRMLFIFIALAFDWGSYLVIYYFEYFFSEQNLAFLKDTLLLYYSSSIVSMSIASIGLLLNHSSEKKYDEDLFFDRMEMKKGWN